MRTLKGFVIIQSLLSNVPGTVSKLGELSTWSTTYTKEKGEYQNIDIPGYRLVSVRSLDTDTGNVEVSTTLADQVIEVVKAAYVYATLHLRPYDNDDFKSTLLADFYNRVSTINFGPMVDNGTLALPEWISWTSVSNNGAAVKIWLSDTAFADQFDEYDITVIPPLAIVDDFFSAPGIVKEKIESRSITQMMELVQEAKGVNPETYIRTLTFNYVSPIVGGQAIPTVWNVLIYGAQGDNIDAIKDAIIEYILANSTHTRAQWEAILPSLFKRTEFIILPRWDIYSVPNLVIQAGLYSSLINPVEAIAFAKAQIDFYTAPHIEQNITILPYHYKAIMLEVINGNTNIEGKEKLSMLFSDYIPVPTTSLDFNRMQEATRLWSILLEEMLIVAEKADAFSSTPRKMRKIYRGEKLYIAALFDNVNYLVAAKGNYGII